MKRTPSALESGASQENKIEDLVGGCAFAVVSLDGLRPNVIYEYGLIRGRSKPMLLFKEKNASVDIAHFFRNAVELALQPPPIDMDKQFSNVKDLHHTEWNRYQIKETVKTIWNAFRAKKADINPEIDVPEPKLCM